MVLQNHTHLASVWKHTQGILTVTPFGRRAAGGTTLSLFTKADGLRQAMELPGPSEVLLDT